MAFYVDAAPGAGWSLTSGPVVNGDLSIAEFTSGDSMITVLVELVDDVTKVRVVSA